MRSGFCAVVAFAFFGAISGGGAARAQPADAKALAEQLFNQARELVKAEKWEEACPKFEASFRYDPVLGTKLNLATCYERTNKLASAWGLYRDAVELARKAGDTKRADYAQKQASALEPRLPKLRISVAAAPPAGLTVKRDGNPIDAGALGVSLYVDPGEHEITAEAPGFQPFRKTITLEERQSESVEVPALVEQPAQPAAAPDAAPTLRLELDQAAPAPPSRTRLYLGLGVGGAGLAAVGVGLVFGAKASSTNDQIEELCGADFKCPAADYEEGQRLEDRASSQATISTALVIGGGVALAAGAVLVLTAPRARERSAAARLVPTTHQAGAGFAVVGSF